MSSYKVSSIHAVIPIEKGARIEPAPIKRIMGRSFRKTELREFGDLYKDRLVIEFQHWIPSFMRILK